MSVAYISDSCSRATDYIYTDHLTSIVLGLVVVSDWRNSLDNSSSSAASLAIGFSDVDPAVDFTNAVDWAMWVDLGSQYHSQVVDLSARPVWGKYIIVRFKCDNPYCEQTTIHSVVTSSSNPH